MTGESTTLENFETVFGQDLNGDGHIGIPPATQPATANVQSLTNSGPESFQFADSNGNGPALQDMVEAPAPSKAVTIAGHDVFVFASHFGQVGIANFVPATDTIAFSKTVFADIRSMLAAAHDDSSGSTIIMDAAHDTITLKQVTTAQLFAHQNDFHFI